jgi:protein-L-isoaspartate(D-aspartate) O-methyltransferase
MMGEYLSFIKQRASLVEILRMKGIRDENVLRAIGNVEREKFVQPAFVHRAYEDNALPISAGQTISQPYTVAFMTECMKIKKGDKVLEIGTGSGYQAAIIYEMGAKVFTIERIQELSLEAQKLFDTLGIKVVCKVGDGSIGWSEYAPYDGIIVTAAAPEVPKTLLGQLADGGRLVAPIGSLDIQDVYVVEKRKNDFFTDKKFGFKFVPLIGKEGWPLNNKK